VGGPSKDVFRTAKDVKKVKQRQIYASPTNDYLVTKQAI
jgi:hypothetical protein